MLFFQNVCIPVAATMRSRRTTAGKNLRDDSILQCLHKKVLSWNLLKLSLSSGASKQAHRFLLIYAEGSSMQGTATPHEIFYAPYI